MPTPSCRTQSTQRSPVCGQVLPLERVPHSRATPRLIPKSFKRVENSGAPQLMRGTIYVSLPFPVAATVGCGAGVKGESTSAGAAPPPISVSSAAAVEQPIRRFLEVTGTLAAQEAAEVAAEVQGRVIATPVERGTRVAEGDALIRIAAAEMEAQAAEAEANAAQIVGRLGLADGSEFSVDKVPEVANARANLDLAQADFDRAQMLFDRKLLAKAEFDQRSAQAEVARRQYDIARNGALQQYQALLAARARVSLAKKALADTTVKSPFAGVVGQRVVCVGDYVARGTTIAAGMRTNPLRVNLTARHQSLPNDAGKGRFHRGVGERLHHGEIALCRRRWAAI